MKALTEKPVVCAEVPPMQPLTQVGFNNRDRYEVGRLVFESPALLGGAAGRMGLSCASCHLNGRGNPSFFLQGVSDAAGRADVTSGLFSRVRGDDIFNPLPIPDIAARDGTQIRDRIGQEFRAKVHGLVVEEFDGVEPPKVVFDALISFLNAQDVANCADPDAVLAVSARSDVRDVSLAFEEAIDMRDRNDLPDAILMARVARERLEFLHERFAAATQKDLRRKFVHASRLIEKWVADLPEAVTHDHQFLGDHLTPEIFRFLRSLEEPVMLHEQGSLYNPDVLRDALERDRAQ